MNAPYKAPFIFCSHVDGGSPASKKRRLVKHSIYNISTLVVLEVCVFFYIDEQRKADLSAAAARGIVMAGNDLGQPQRITSGSESIQPPLK